MMVFNFSSAYREQGFLSWLKQQSTEEPLLLDCEAVEGCTCYCDPAAQKEILSKLPASLPPVRWLDSGDYHYLSYLLSLREKEPFHLVLLDNHPDNQAPSFEGVLSCGSWVKELEEKNPLVRDILTIGPEGCPEEIPAGWIEKRRGERVYVSLDKDILGRDRARTDWTQGTHSLEQVLQMLASLCAQMQAVALDICGELSESKGATPEDLRINLETNIELYTFIQNHLK